MKQSQQSVPDVEKSTAPDTNSEVVCSSKDVNTVRKCSLSPNILLECSWSCSPTVYLKTEKSTEVREEFFGTTVYTIVATAI